MFNVCLVFLWYKLYVWQKFYQEQFQYMLMESRLIQPLIRLRRSMTS